MNYTKSLKIIRSVFGMEQRELAKLVDVNPSYISMIELGKKNPSKKILQKISKKLNIPIELISLIADENNKKIDEETKLKLGELLLRTTKNVSQR